MPKRGPTQELAEFAAEIDGNRLPDAVRSTLGDLLLDYIRVASIGSTMPWSSWAGDYIRQTAAPGPASVLFSNASLDPVHATFLNATYAGSIDSDDTHVGSMLHPGAIVFSAALAAGQTAKSSGADVLAAVAAGYEAMIRIALAIQPTHFRRGFQSTATCGGFGAAVAAARLLLSGPDLAHRIAATIGLVASFSGGLTQFYRSGSTVKRIHAAHAAESGMAAAVLARSGFDGPTDILEGENGFARAYADAADFGSALAGLGKEFRLLEVTVKGHSCSARVLAAIEGMLMLREQHGFSGDDIAGVRIGIPKIIAGRLTLPNPVDVQAAQMSLPYSVALAASMPGANSETALTVRDFENGLSDPGLMPQEKIAIEIDDEVEAATSKESVAAKLNVALKSGHAYEIFVDAPRGSPSRPYKSVQHIARFRQELTPRFGEKPCDMIVEASRDPATLDVQWLGNILAGGDIGTKSNSRRAGM